MLASTIQFSSNEQTPTPHPPPTRTPYNTGSGRFDGRRARQDNRPSETQGLFPQDPTACHEPHPQPPGLAFPTGHPAVLTAQNPGPRLSCRCSTREQPPQHERLQQANPEHPHPSHTGPGHRMPSAP